MSTITFVDYGGDWYESSASVLFREFYELWLPLKRLPFSSWPPAIALLFAKRLIGGGS